MHEQNVRVQTCGLRACVVRVPHAVADGNGRLDASGSLRTSASADVFCFLEGGGPFLGRHFRKDLPTPAR